MTINIYTSHSYKHHILRGLSRITHYIANFFFDITYDFNYCGSPAWSPRGDRIAFVAMDDGNNFNVYTIAPDGSDAVRLTSGGSNENPVWSPDGRFLVFSSTRAGAADLYVMRADGSGLRRLTWSGGNTMPSWSGF